VSPTIEPGGLAAVLAHPDDESFACAGAFALAHDAGRTTRLLVATRGEAGTPDGVPDPDFGGVREAELIGADARPRRSLDPRWLPRRRSRR
jgi:LmbE family N-acetylglucosaminyl deacetylase